MPRSSMRLWRVGGRERLRSTAVVDAIMTTSQGAIMAKAGLVELGVIEHATVRLPLVESTPEHLEKLRAGLAASGLA